MSLFFCFFFTFKSKERTTMKVVKYFCAMLLAMLLATVQLASPEALRTIAAVCSSCPNTPSLFTQQIHNGAVSQIEALNLSTTFRVILFPVTSNTSESYIQNRRAFLVDNNVVYILGTGSEYASLSLLQLSLPHLLMTVFDPVVVVPALANRTQVMVFRDDQVGFLAGLLAGSQTRSGSVGIVAGPKSAPIMNMRAGFQQGVLAACPSCLISGTYLSTFSASSVNVSLVANAMLALGPDVVWCAGGSGGSAVLMALTQRGIFGIGVDADEYLTTFAAVQNETRATRLLGSSLKRTDIASSFVMNEYLGKGLFTPALRLLGAEQGCVQLSPCHRGCGALTQRTNETLAVTLRRMGEGLTSTGVDTDTGSIARDRSSFTAEFPKMNSIQQVPLSERYVAVTTVWNRVLVIDGSWESLAFYDDELSTMERVLSVVPPAAAPNITTGFAVSSVTLSSGEEIALLAGGLQDGIAGSKMFSLTFPCANFQGGCTYRAVWTLVTAVKVTSRHGDALTSPPALTDHASASRPFSSVMYVAGGKDAAGVPTAAVWRVTLHPLSSTAVTSVWQELQPLDAPLFDFTLALWYSSISNRTMLIAAGGPNGTLTWRDANASTDWIAPHAPLLPGLIVPRPCLYTQDTTTVVLVGAERNGSNFFLRPDIGVAYPQDNLRNVTSAVLEVLQDDRISCAMVSNTIPTPTLVGFAGERQVLQATYSTIALVSMTNTASTQRLVTYNMPHIQCDKDRNVFLSSDLTYCQVCAVPFGGAYCSNLGLDSGGISSALSSSIGVVLIATLVPVLFLLGLVVGLVLVRRLFGRGPTQNRDESLAPRGGKVVLCFVNVIGSYQVWRTNPRQAAATIAQGRMAISKLASRYQCYEVRCLADSVLLVSSSLESMLTFASEVQRCSAMRATDEKASAQEVATGEWKDRVIRRWVNWPQNLSVRVTVHQGTPVIEHEETSGFDYSGPDVDMTISARLLGGAGDIVVPTALFRELPPTLLSQCALELTSRLGGNRELMHGGKLVPFEILRRKDSHLPTPSERRPSRTTTIESGALGGAHSITAEDVTVQMPDFQLCDDDPTATMNASASQRYQSHSIKGGPSSGGASLSMTMMHIFNAHETQHLVQFVALSLEMLMLPLEMSKKKEMLSRLCETFGVCIDGSHHTFDPLMTLLSKTSTDDSGGSGTQQASQTTMKLASAMLQHIDVLELRSLLSELHLTKYTRIPVAAKTSKAIEADIPMHDVQ